MPVRAYAGCAFVSDQTVSSRRFDAIVLGAGAAGLLCAAEAGKRGRRVAVLERAERAGKKILISGGGRCNFTNIHCNSENFISANPHFAKSALARFTPADFIAVVEKYRIPYHEKTLGQLFCDRSAQDITGLLESECRDAGVKIFLNARVCEVAKTMEFVVRTESEEFRAQVLVVATGGLSIPKMGATPFGYELARQFGLKIQPTRPALVPLVFGRHAQKQYCDLAEVSAGGVDTDELSSKTMESRKAPGLFFIGEVVDVTGHLGGFNFQWAWASGAAAARSL